MLEKSKHGKPTFIVTCDRPFEPAGGNLPLFVRAKPQPGDEGSNYDSG